MPVLANAKKALRASRRKAAINRRTRSKMRTSVVEFKAQPDQTKLPSAFSAIDRAAKQRIIHPNKAARFKRQLNRQAKAS